MQKHLNIGKNLLKFLGNIKNIGFDNTFRRLWEYYLSYCEGGFKSGNINVGQFLIKKV